MASPSAGGADDLLDISFGASAGAGDAGAAGSAPAAGANSASAAADPSPPVVALVADAGTTAAATDVPAVTATHAAGATTATADAPPAKEVQVFSLEASDAFLDNEFDAFQSAAPVAVAPAVEVAADTKSDNALTVAPGSDWDAFQSAAPVAAAPAVEVAADPQSGNVLAAAPESAWDAFQSAASVAAAPAVEVAAAPQSDIAPTAAPEPSSASNPADLTFDPLLDSRSAEEKAGVLTCTDLAALDTKSAEVDNLIALASFNEFDPMLSPGQASSPPAAASSSSAAPKPPAAPDSEVVAAPAMPAVTTPVAGAQVATANRGGTQVADSRSGAGAADLLGLGGDAPPPAARAEELEAAMAGEVPVVVEDIQKVAIYVYHKGEKNIVGWYADTRPSDIREAVLCACDAIIDGGFVLREVEFTGEDQEELTEDGAVFHFEEFDRLQNGQTYIIESAQERDDLKNITGDRWRRLKICVDPLLHVEAQKAIDKMRRGSNLLKHTYYGFPHLRQFQLSDDKKRLVWYSGAKRKEDSVVQLDELTEIRLGQSTAVFLHYRLPMLEHLSFSLIYGPKGTKTLDLTCKDEFEFDSWLTGLKAIFYHFKSKPINKEQLLGHSKRFKKALDKHNVGIKLTKLPEVKEKGHVGLDDCIEIVTHTPKQLDTKLESLHKRLKTMSQQVARLDHHASAEMEVDFSLLTGQGPAYAGVFAQDEDAQDEEMEIRRMHELVEQTTQVLQQARSELTQVNERAKEQPSGSAENAARGKKKETAACKQIDQLLWKAEVDLENVEDMYLRHVDNQKDTTTPFSASVAEMNQRFTQAATDMEDAVSKKMLEIKSWFAFR